MKTHYFQGNLQTNDVWLTVYNGRIRSKSLDILYNNNNKKNRT